MTEEKHVVLGGSDLNALASGTRRNLLKSLKEKRKTASELALEKKMSVQSVSEQLNKLEKSGLVKRASNGKWVYYELTEKSTGLIDSGVPKKFFILLSTAILALFTGLFRFLTMQTGSLSASSASAPLRSTSQDLVYGSAKEAAATSQVSQIASKALSEGGLHAAGIGREFAFSAVELLLIAIGAFLLVWALYAVVRKK